jgi:hypothetical protein
MFWESFSERFPIKPEQASVNFPRQTFLRAYFIVVESNVGRVAVPVVKE